ncbi:chemotaxis protein MotB [Campylobacter pinnipediorum subsp. caledonicus]|uniref:OmpA family protein n=1 Tax=Campylobacter pinnipediorum TaxID=1965231 RepID=UPI0009952799|nr:OmpA family protein [Campylobacter pinnipediorum]AQW86293.1 putative protein (OmpA/MotB domain) [Campylobacter pinnipediorum subsp. caledonicus]OPA71394.1 chemotaxis protein MotB [Campylobacter pinnipediorum subsp. caledonicus]
MKFQNNQEENNQTFWISYADLMAGLLFVFMLIVGAIVVKYVLSQNILANKEQTIIKTLENLKDEQGKNLSLDKLNAILKNEILKANANNIELQELNKNLTSVVADLKSKLQILSDTNSEYMADIDGLKSNNYELSENIADLNSKIVSIENKLSNAEVNATNLNMQNNQNLKIIDELTYQISDKDDKYNVLLKDLNITKNHIKSLTGIRVKVITALKDKLGKSIEIDPVSGALKLRSSVLFNKNEAKLKDEAKSDLKDTLQKYFDVLLNDPDISKNIDQVMIEGFTDSDGSYLYNLELSQRRAYEVMRFINSYNSDKKLSKLLVASGRSFNNLVLKDGKEDKEASRRIEIKFSISNKDALEQIEKLLEQKQ